MATRTAKGTAQEKTSGTTLTISNVEIDTNAAILVGIGFDQSQDVPDVKWGNTSLTKIRSRLDSTSGIGTALYMKANVWNGRTADIVATWSSAIGARAMCAVQWTGCIIEDIGRNNIQASTTTPNSLMTGLSEYDYHFNWCIHSSAGPVEDTPGTIEGTYGYSQGQRVGTTGGGLDVTIQETWRNFEETTDSRSRMTGATEQAWVTCITVLRDHTQLGQGITPSDIIACQAKFESELIDTEDMVFGFNEALDRWEVFNVSRSSLPSPTAHSNNGWQ
jgi:hypothetical protein